MSAATQRPANRYNSFLDKTVKFDIFGKDFALAIENDEQAVKSRSGCCLTIILTVIVALYGYQKTEVLFARSDMSIQEHTESNALAETDKFGYETGGFNIALAYSGYNNNYEYELPPEVGRIAFRAEEWGIHPNGTGWYETKYLDSHVCTREELGLEEDQTNAKFMPIKPNAWQCLDDY